VKLVLVDDVSVLVPAEDTKLVEPILAGAEHFQLARAQTHPDRIDTSFAGVLGKFQPEAERCIDLKELLPVDLASAVCSRVDIAGDPASARLDALRVNDGLCLPAVMLARQIRQDRRASSCE
jgi:hypothetical protein